MKSKPCFISPKSRIILFIGISLSLIWSEVINLFITYSSLLILCHFSGQIRFHIKVIIASVLPFTILSVLVSWLIINDSKEPILFLAIPLRVAILTALFQFTFSLNAIELIDLLNCTRLSKKVQLILLEAYCNVHKLHFVAQQIISARLSRAYVKKRSFISLAYQTPFIIRPLISSLFNNIYDSAANWKQLKVIEKFEMCPKNEQLGHYDKQRSIYILIVCLFNIYISIIIKQYSL